MVRLQPSSTETGTGPPPPSPNVDPVEPTLPVTKQQLQAELLLAAKKRQSKSGSGNDKVVPKKRDPKTPSLKSGVERIVKLKSPKFHAPKQPTAEVSVKEGASYVAMTTEKGEGKIKRERKPSSMTVDHTIKQAVAAAIVE